MPPKKKMSTKTRRSSTANKADGFTTQTDLDIVRDYGVFVYPNFDIYVGWFLLNREDETIVRQGLGTYFVYVGGYYTGRWIQDQLCRGKIKYPNGAVFWGKFNEMHMPQGDGMYYFPNRGWLTAKFVKGIPLANIEFLDKNYGEWLGTPLLVSEHIVFQKRNIFMNRASFAKAKRISEKCTEADRHREASYRTKPVCMPLSVALQLKPSVQELFDTILEKKGRTGRNLRQTLKKKPQLGVQKSSV